MTGASRDAQGRFATLSPGTLARIDKPSSDRHGVVVRVIRETSSGHVLVNVGSHGIKTYRRDALRAIK